MRQLHMILYWINHGYAQARPLPQDLQLKLDQAINDDLASSSLNVSSQSVKQGVSQAVYQLISGVSTVPPNRTIVYRRVPDQPGEVCSVDFPGTEPVKEVSWTTDEQEDAKLAESQIHSMEASVTQDIDGRLQRIEEELKKSKEEKDARALCDTLIQEQQRLNEMRRYMTSGEASAFIVQTVLPLVLSMIHMH
jgi:hypothetical protein